MESYIRYEEAGIVTVEDMTGFDLDRVLTHAAALYASSDYRDIEMLEIVHDGNKYTYDGWQPGMTYTFRNAEGEIIWSNSFPDWDH